MVAIDLGVNIIASIIYDVAKKVYSFASSEEKRIKAQIRKHIKENINDEYSNLLETGGFDEFFKLPLVSDVINSYIIYVINGALSDKLKAIAKEKTRHFIQLSDDDILSYLVKCFIEIKSNSVVTYNNSELRRFFKHIFDLTNNFFTLKINLENKIQIFEINRRFNRGFNVLTCKLDKCYALIESTMKFPLIEKNIDFDRLRKKYMDILKLRHNKALIYLLDEFDLDKFYIPPALATKRCERIVPVSNNFNNNFVIEDDLLLKSSPFEKWENIFSRENIVYITGGAGYGKSLMMKNIIINYDQLNINASLEHIVIYGEIKWFIKKDGLLRSMTEFLIECINNYTLERVDAEFVNYHLAMGRCILLLDALDEVPMEKRGDLHQTIMAHLKNLNPNNKVCLTSRDRGFIPVEEEIEHYSILPLSPSHIEEYVDKIIKLGKFNKHDKEPFMQQAKALVEKRFLNSFLILSLLINIYKGERELPETKLELYQKCLEYISNKREKQKTVDNFDWKLIAPLMKDNTFIELSLLCFPNNKEVKEVEVSQKLCEVYKDAFVDPATLLIAVNEFLKFCYERTELFVPANIENTFRFFHRSFYEYFYSKHIVLRSSNSSEIYEKLIQFDVDSEVFELTLARLKQETQDKYIDLVRYVINKATEEIQQNNVNFKAFTVLVLFFQVLDEVTFQNIFIDFLIVNRDKIVKNIDKISNQEIIVNTIIRANRENEIISAYEANSLTELLGFAKSINPQELEFIINKSLELKEEERISEQVVWQLNVSRMRPFKYESHFYTILLMRRDDFITIFRTMTQKLSPIKRKIKNKIENILKFYDSQNPEAQKALNDVLFLSFQDGYMVTEMSSENVLPI
ncbi:MAG: NACHT domain-containing protein [Eubacteriales bacterium]